MNSCFIKAVLQDYRKIAPRSPDMPWLGRPRTSSQIYGKCSSVAQRTSSQTAHAVRCSSLPPLLRSLQPIRARFRWDVDGWGRGPNCALTLWPDSAPPRESMLYIEGKSRARTSSSPIRTTTRDNRCKSSDDLRWCPENALGKSSRQNRHPIALSKQWCVHTDFW